MDPDTRSFSTADAAASLGFRGPSSVKYPLSTSKALTPDAVIGKELMFTRATRDHSGQRIADPAARDCSRGLSTPPRSSGATNPAPEAAPEAAPGPASRAPF